MTKTYLLLIGLLSLQISLFAKVPTLSTTAVTATTFSVAVSGGNITSTGGTLTAKGICWNTASNPTIANSKTVITTGLTTGVFTSSTTATLVPGTTYYLRAYATNSSGTAYGNQITFKPAFQTLAPTVSNITTTSMDVTLAVNGNLSTTEFCIKAPTDGATTYVQANGTLGTVCVWKTAALWGSGGKVTVTGLSPNTNHTFSSNARSAVGIETGFGATSSTYYTLATIPTAPTVNNLTISTIDLLINANGNPTNTEFAIQEAGGNYVQANGTLAATAVWQTAAVWGTKTVSGLTANTTYSFQVKARNANFVETAFGIASNATTLVLAPNTPTAPTVNNITVSTLAITVNTNGNTTDTEYAIQEIGGKYVQADGTLNTTTVWQTAAVWGTKTVSGLTANTAYSFQIKARNTSGVETVFGASTAVYTLANTPAAPTVNGATETSLNVTINENGNPPTTEFAIKEVSTLQKYILTDGTIGTNSTAVWQTKAAWGSPETVLGLTPNTNYIFSSKSRNGTQVISGFSPSSTTVATLPAAPVSTAATGIATDGFTATWTAPVQGNVAFTYNMDYGTAADLTGATTIANIPSTNLNQPVSSLTANTVYYYRVNAVNSSGSGSESQIQSVTTLAITPGSPTIANPTTSSVDVSINANGNPTNTEYAIQEIGGNYVQATGTLAAIAVWQTAASWGTKTIIGLTANTAYSFQVKARNISGVETGFGTAVGVNTLENLLLLPEAPTVANVTIKSVDITINPNGNPAETDFAIQEAGGNYVQADGSLNTSIVWQTAAAWGIKTVTGLTGSSPYSFQVKARNTTEETTFSSQTAIYTLGTSTKTISINPSDDAYVRTGSYAATNFGTATTLDVKDEPASADYSRMSYIKFNLTEVPSGFTSAKLKIYGTSTASPGWVYLYAVSNNNWSESTLNYNNKPTYETKIDSIHYNGNGWNEVDLTSYVRSELTGDMVLGFCIKQNNAEAKYWGFSSKESTYKPVLEVVVPTIIPCEPGSNGVPADIKQTVSSGSASSTYAGYEITKSFDGNLTTFYNSAAGVVPFPCTLNYNFTNVDKIDYIVYTPRPGTNPVGNLIQSEIWYSTTAAPTTFTKMCDYNFNAPSGVVKFIFPAPVIDPATIRFVVNSGYGDRATCAEMEFYKFGPVGVDVSNIFEDNLCSRLKSNITQSNIDGIAPGFYKNLAQGMFDGTYNAIDRVQVYEPYPKATTVATGLKIGGLSPYENPTGIYLDSASVAIVYVGETYGQQISLTVYDFQSKSRVSRPLSTGRNVLTIADNGLGYIDYFSDNYASLLPVKIHIASGKVHGYYDVNNTTAQHWRAMVSNPATTQIDLKGNFAFLHYPVSILKQYNPVDAKELVQLYDSIVSMQFRQMGLYKYNKIPKNHVYAEATDGAFSWYNNGTVSHYEGSVDATCNPAGIKNNPWGVAHEIGHGNQVRPGLKWIGTTEVTNNIYSAWATYNINPACSKLMELQVVNDAYYDGYETGTGIGKGNSIAGGRFNSYFNNGILKGQRFLCQYGADDLSTSGWENAAGDHFVKLCQLWQLELYYQIVHPEKAEWFADICEKVRNTNETGLSHGTLQLNFMKNVCDATGEDLTGFFRKSGMLRTIDMLVSDYSTAQLTITPADSTALINYVASKGYNAPATPVLYYVSLNSVNAFKNQLSVVGGTLGQGCVASAVDPTDGGYKNYVTVDHAVWQNVVVFETYSNNTLVRISMVGSGYPDNSKTRVYYPTGATSIYAVAWDGVKTLVYGAGGPQGVKRGGDIISNLELSSTKLVLYPNPVTDAFRVSGVNGIVTLNVTDLCGRRLFTKKVANNEAVSVSSLAKGVYIVEINSETGSVLLKLERE